MGAADRYLLWRDSPKEPGSAPVPTNTRRTVMRRCEGRCEDCGDRRATSLHHLHYRSVGFEEPHDLAALCWDCHQARHRDYNGDYWRDPEGMEDHWWMYHNEMEKG